MDTHIHVPQHPQERLAGARAGDPAPSCGALRSTGWARTAHGAAPAALGTGGGRGTGRGWCCALQVGWSAYEEGLHAAPRWHTGNMGTEWRCGGEVWESQTCFCAPWVPGPCHGAGQGMRCFLRDPKMGKRPVLAPTLDPKPGTGFQSLRAGVAHPGAAPAGLCRTAARGGAGDHVPPRCPPRLRWPGR